LREHPAFAPILGGWGALLGALVVLVLPVAMIDEALAETGLAGLGSLAQWLLAAIAALVTGGILFLIASKLSVKATEQQGAGNLVRAASSFLRPIDPVEDLGSPSFDEPFSHMPFAVPQAEPNGAPPEAAQPAEVDPAEAPRELDLAQFAQLPGRNAVWVDEAVAEPRHDTAEPEVPAPPAPLPVLPSATALARLRAVPPEELSTVQMVERFAAALHEHRDPATGRAQHQRVTASREAALAEALKSLATLSKPDSSPETGEPLRDAIAQLQSRRGAA
jgi:hypothetical protein